MSLALKEGADTTGLPTITLAGGKYSIARLPLRRTLEIVKLLPKLNATIAKLPKAFDGGVVEITDADLEPLAGTVLQALLPLHPGATMDDLMDLPIELGELIAAIPIIAAQGSSRTAQQAEVSSQPKSE